jgi:glycosyltransferase involved in cell wall biosynthesis
MGNGASNILFISYDGMTDPLGQSQVLPYLQGLSRNGYTIFLLSCEKKEAYGQNKALVEQMLKGYDINWTPLSYTRTPPVFSTLADIIKLKKTAKKIHRLHHMDMVHTRPGIPALVGLWMKKKMGVRFLNDIREFYADSRVEGHMWNLKNPMYKMIYHHFRKKEREELAQSDGIVCLTHVAKKIVAQWPEYKVGVPMEVIPCSADLSLFDPAMLDETKKTELRTDLGIENNDFIISYLGSVGGWYLIEEMMRFYKIIADKRTDAKFLFISPHRHDEIIAAAARAGLPKEKIITRKAGRQEVPLLLSLSDYSVFFIRPCYSKLSSSPTKHGEIMAMGIPLVTNSGVGDVKEVVLQYNSGIVLDNFADADLTAAAAAMANGAHYDASLIRQGAKDFYSLENAVGKYTQLYRAILNR